MKSVLSNERGYTLFIALLIAILFTVLAMSMLSITMSGLTKNTTREQLVQAQELSEKGLKHITQDIQTQLKAVLASEENGLERDKFTTELNKILVQFACGSGGDLHFKSTDINNGEYKACIDITAPDRDPDKPRQIVTFRSVGDVDGKTKLLTTKLELGAEAGPDFLKYAVSTFKTDECQEQPNKCDAGEGNLFLHGGVEIAGDMNVDGNLITTNRSHEDYLIGDYWIASYFPSVVPAPNATESHLIVNGGIYTFTHQPKYSDHIKRTDFSTGPYRKVTNVNDAFVGGKAPTKKVQREPKRNDIPISEQENKFKYNPSDANRRVNTSVFGSDGITREIKGINYPNDSVFPYYCVPGVFNECFLGFSPDYGGNYYFVGNNHAYKFATNGNLQIGGIAPPINRMTTSFGKQNNQGQYEGGLYVKGNLTIGNAIYQTSDYKVNVRGPIFVNGDLTIQGVDGNFDALIYVKGKVTIKHSLIKEMVKQNGKRGSLIIFAEKEIVIERNNRFASTPAPIHGFFYSKEGIQMFGTEMNAEIVGGISAPRIVLNAIRGRSSLLPLTNPARWDTQFIEFRYYEGTTEQEHAKSRLRVVYDPEIINTYSDLTPEDRVYNVLPPEVIDRVDPNE